MQEQFTRPANNIKSEMNDTSKRSDAVATVSVGIMPPTNNINS